MASNKSDQLANKLHVPGADPKADSIWKGNLKFRSGRINGWIHLYRYKRLFYRIMFATKFIQPVNEFVIGKVIFLTVLLL